MDFKDSFKKKLKTAKMGLEVSSNPNSLFESLSTELQSEIESNKVLKFKSKLRESLKTGGQAYELRDYRLVVPPGSRMSILAFGTAAISRITTAINWINK